MSLVSFVLNGGIPVFSFYGADRRGWDEVFLHRPFCVCTVRFLYGGVGFVNAGLI